MLIGAETRRALPDRSIVEAVPGLRVKGKEMAVDAYLLHALAGSPQTDSWDRATTVAGSAACCRRRGLKPPHMAERLPTTRISCVGSRTGVSNSARSASVFARSPFSRAQPVLDEVAEASRRLCAADEGSHLVARRRAAPLASHRGGSTGRGERASSPGRSDDGGRPYGSLREPVHIPDVLADPEYDHRPTALSSDAGRPDHVRSPSHRRRRSPGLSRAVHREHRGWSRPSPIRQRSRGHERACSRRSSGNARALAFHLASDRQAHRERGRRAAPGRRGPASPVSSAICAAPAFVETAAPEELFDVLREYHGALSALIPT